jgi:SAM-dependent methyltransferase
MAAPANPAEHAISARSEFDAWEQWYLRRDYRKMPWYSPRPSPWLVRAVRERDFRPRASILDAGCGTGTNTIWLRRQGFRVTGVDISPTAISIAATRARRAGVTVDLRVASVDKLPFGRESFEAAVDTGCFHSIPMRLRTQYSREIARVLSPDARFLLTWIPREVRSALGPPHRPSLEEVSSAFEPWFVFDRVARYGSGTPEGWKVSRERFGRCTALLVRRHGRQPPTR